VANRLVFGRAAREGDGVIDRVAVLADVHCVLPALLAVLAEEEVRGADRIVLAGDVTVGPQPERTIDVIRDLGERVVWVSGNCERVTVELARGTREPDADLALAAWGAAQLRPGQVELLESLPKTATLPIRGLGEVLFCHATPRDDEEFVLVDSGIPRWNAVLDGVPETVSTVVCGHTHMPFLRLVDRRVVVNPGSVGMPYGTAGAHWALLGGSDGPAIQLRRTLYDVDAAERNIRAGCDYPGIDEWITHYLRHPASDVEALEVFGRKAV
jgi:predicted phosphodiesterase